jgi:hypothetical protein
LNSQEDVEFFTQLEGYLQMDAPHLIGWDQQVYHSYYAPIMHVVDRDLCALSHEEQVKTAKQLD